MNDPFIIMKWPSLSRVIFFVMKSTLILIHSHSSFLLSSVGTVDLFYPFPFNLLVYFYWKWVSCRRHAAAPGFLIKDDNLCLLTEMIRAFTFSVITEVARLNSITLVRAFNFSVLICVPFSFFFCLPLDYWIFFMIPFHRLYWLISSSSLFCYFSAWF